MKSRPVIFIFFFAIIAWSCGSKSETANNGIVSSGVSAVMEDELTSDATPKAAQETNEVDDTTNGSASLVRLTDAQKRKKEKLEKETSERMAQRKRVMEERAKVSPTFTDKEGNIVYNKAEVDPQFDGGEKALKKYLRKNLEYPDDAERQGLEGTVFVDFVVTSNGTVHDVEVTENTNETVTATLRAEAVRVVSAMPKWVPGRQHGKPVAVRYSLPITFRLM